MRFSGMHVRGKVYALLLTLVALWAYAAFLTARDAMDLLRVRMLSERLGQPTDSLILDLQAERRLTVTTVGSPGQSRTALTAQRARTDASVAALRRFAQNTDIRLAGTGAVRKRAGDLVTRLDGMGSIRDAIDAGRLDRDKAAASYTAIIDAGFAVYGSQWTSRETQLIEDTRALVALARAREVLAQEDVLVAGALAAGRMTDVEQRRLIELVGTGQFVGAQAAAALPAAERARYEQLIAGQSFASLRPLEDALIHRRTGEPTPVKPQAWQAATEPVLSGLRELVANGVRDSVGRATPPAAGVIIRTGVVGGLGLVAVAGAILVSISTMRTAARRLGQLRAGAVGLAELELPEIAARLRRGEPIDRLPESPPSARSDDTIGQVGQAIDTARRAAVRTMMEVAGSQAETSEIFLHHTQRNQILLRRQLGLLEAMERRETDADELAGLFRVDHLTTRIRRNVEKLISMAGGNPGRRWLRPVPLLDVVRAAVAEVEDYPRVLMSPTWTGAVAGSTLPDLIHVLAELIENGLSFSQPSTTVRISGELWDGGVAIVINDDGPGLSSPELAAANQLLRDPPEPSATSGGGGLSVVGQLARRRGVTVELRRSPRGGTTAVVLIPATLVLDAGDAGVTDDGSEQTAEYPQVSAGADAGTPVSPSALHATPAGLPVRRRRVDVDAPSPPPAHNLGTPPLDVGAPPAASHNRTENARAWGPVTGGSATVELAVTRAAPDEPAATPPASDHRP